MSPYVFAKLFEVVIEENAKLYGKKHTNKIIFLHKSVFFKINKHLVKEED